MLRRDSRPDASLRLTDVRVVADFEVADFEAADFEAADFEAADWGTACRSKRSNHGDFSH